MIIRAYLEWSRNATTQERAEAVAALSDVYLGAEISPEERQDAEAALVLALEDPSPLVRRAMAVALGGSEKAPRSVIAALARDQADIAGIVIANSPILTDEELIDLVAFGTGILQSAAASRPYVSQDLAAAIAAASEPEAAVTLMDNPGAEVPLDSLRLLAERHGENGLFREAMLARGDLPPEIHLALADAAARQLSAFAHGLGWLPQHRAERVRREATECAAVVVALAAPDGAMQQLVAGLRKAGQLTPQLLMRAVLSGEVRLFVAALADLAEVDPPRAQGFVLGRSMMGFGALYRRAGLPKAFEPAFAAALAAWQELSKGFEVAEGRLSRVMIEMVLSAVTLLEGPDAIRLRALLMAWQAEAAREDARARALDLLTAPPAGMADQPPLDLSARLEDALALELQQAA